MKKYNEKDQQVITIISLIVLACLFIPHITIIVK